MSDRQKSEKPQTVLYAECALWVWTAWTCFYGIYQSWISVPDIQKMVLDQLQGMVSLEPKTMREMIIVGYGLLAAISGWFVVKIGAGKNWARASFLWGFVLEVLCLVLPPYHDAVGYLADIPDFGLQAIALCLLYTSPGRDWFQRKEH